MLVVRLESESYLPYLSHPNFSADEYLAGLDAIADRVASGYAASIVSAINAVDDIDIVDDDPTLWDRPSPMPFVADEGTPMTLTSKVLRLLNLR